MARSRYKFINKEQPHFLTCTVVNWISVFGIPNVSQIILDSLQFLQSEKRIKLFAFVIMEHHIHLVAQAENIEKEIKNFKSFTARKIIDYFIETDYKRILKQLSNSKKRYKIDRDYQFWQEASHPEQIINYEMMTQKIDYIHNNPVSSGFVDKDIHWRYSSARNYSELHGVIDVTTEW
ncbi:MAG: transposase [Candidatus Cloacimonetes bacterium]|nr:transposase [Candidatus Cloacimonadota bacterium]